MGLRLWVGAAAVVFLVGCGEGLGSDLPNYGQDGSYVSSRKPGLEKKLCRNVDCGEGTCFVEAGLPRCACDEGFVAAALSCVPGVAGCGDGSCDAAEDCGSCAADCGACPASCGDGACDAAEDCGSCAADCGGCPVSCGDGTCDADEDCGSCAADCGGCPASCGDGTCDADEDCGSCAADCGMCPASCGDGTCDADEDCGTCAADCGACAGRVHGSLRIDPAFSAAALPADVQGWYTRLWTAIANPNQYLNATEMASSNDTYKYGRALSGHIVSLLHVLRVTGDPRLLQEVDRLAQLMRAELQDWSIIRYGGTTYEADGYLNWQYWYDESYQGTDVHQMDEILSHSLVAAMAWAFEVNRDLNPTYGERADFWVDYLKNHFEAKWRARKGKPTGPFMDKYLTHAYSQWIMYHHYMWLLTGEAWYRLEAERKVEVVRRQVVDTGRSFVWSHYTTQDPGSSSTKQWCQPFVYARKTVQVLVDLHLEGYYDQAFMTKVAGTVSDRIMDNGTVDLAPDVCGGVDVAGLQDSGYARERVVRYGISAYTEAGAWDASGKVEQLAEGMYGALESAENPRRVFIPAGIVFSRLY